MPPRFIPEKHTCPGPKGAVPGSAGKCRDCSGYPQYIQGGIKSQSTDGYAWLHYWLLSVIAQVAVPGSVFCNMPRR